MQKGGTRFLQFGEIVKILQKYSNPGISQMKLMENLFTSVRFDDVCPYELDDAQVSRWITGKSRVSPTIVAFYRNNKSALSHDIQQKILSDIYDPAMAVDQVYTLLMRDNSISGETKGRLTEKYPCRTDEDKAAFLGSVLFFAMQSMQC